MELFKFIPNPSDITSSFLQQGQFINHVTKAEWIERYREPGSFTFNAPVSSELRAFLPLGTLISHIDTLEVMIVENHEIDESDKDKEPEVIISGRSLDAWLENRGVGADVAETGLFTSAPIPDYALPFDTTWNQITALINLQIVLGPPTLDDPGGRPLISVGDKVDGFIAISDEQHIVSGVAAERIITRGVLHDKVLELLAIDDFGIRSVRPNPASVHPGVTEFRIHNGVDRSGYVIFSHLRGDLKNAHYFWSNVRERNDSFIVTTFLNYRYHPADWLDHQGYNRRILYTEASDLDSQVPLDPDSDYGYDFTDYFEAGRVRSADEIRASRQTGILSTDISATTSYKYRRDYDVGDLVTVRGNYDVSSVMRVTEHVEFQDETGETGYPTLSSFSE